MSRLKKIENKIFKNDLSFNRILTEGEPVFKFFP